jgi:hypothetical protein
MMSVGGVVVVLWWLEVEEKLVRVIEVVVRVG